MARHTIRMYFGDVKLQVQYMKGIDQPVHMMN